MPEIYFPQIWWCLHVFVSIGYVCVVPVCGVRLIYWYVYGVLLYVMNRNVYKISKWSDESQKKFENIYFYFMAFYDTSFYSVHVVYVCVRLDVCARLCSIHSLLCPQTLYTLHRHTHNDELIKVKPSVMETVNKS